MSTQPDSISEPLFPKKATAYWTGTLLVMGVVCLAVFYIVFSLIFEAMAETTQALIAGTFWAFIVGLIILIFAATNLGFLRKKFGNVHFDGETISIFDRRRICGFTARLADCRWFIGNRTWATVPPRDNLFGIGTGKTILIVFPDSVRTSETAVYGEGPAIVAVGLTHETRFQWEQVIYQLSVEKDVDRELLAPPVSQTFWGFWMLCALPLSWFWGMRISIISEHLLTKWNVPADIALGISFPLFVPGIIIIFLLLVVVPYLWRKRQDVYHAKSDRDSQWALATPISVGCVLFIFRFWMVAIFGNGNDWTYRSAIAATLVCVMMGLALFFVFWKFLVKPRKDVVPLDF